MPQQEMQVSLLKGDMHGQNVEYRDNISVNCSAIVRPILGAQGYMLQEPGLTLLGSGLGTDRGGVWNEKQEQHFRVSGSAFISVTANGAVTTLGIAGAGAFPVSLPYSNQTQAIISNSRMYLYNGSIFKEVIDENLGNPIDGVWVDGYYMLTDGDFLYHTDLQDESSISPLKYSGSDFSPDPLKGVSLTTDNKVMAWNRYSIEYFVNEAAENFAFTRIPSRNVEYGLVATHAKASIGGAWFFVGGTKNGDVSVYNLSVGTAVAIASRDVSQMIQQYSEDELANIVLESRVDDDYEYLILHLPNITLKCNLTVMKVAGKENAWSILKTDTVGNRTWRSIHGIYEPRLGKWVYGDKRSNAIGYLDPTVTTHYGAKVECALFTPFIFLDSASIDELEIFTIPGLNTVDDASCFVSFTYDGIHFGTELALNYGNPGGYMQRFGEYRFGYVDNWFGMKLRWISESKMAFSLARIVYG
tara:strand:- start:1328 stop:2743 length:1416 start_codon:yes stop_codon:yes gene_type:complete